MNNISFRTPVKPLQGHCGEVSHNDRILMMGSCFSDNIGSLLCRNLFDVVVNPFGALYNPLSIQLALERLADGAPMTRGELFEHNGLWHSFMFHSAYSCQSPEMALELMNRSIDTGSRRLRDATVIAITLGSAKAFTLCDSGLTVANCHKLPASSFESVNLSVEDVTQALDKIIATIGRVNSEARVILTVSPIRHTGYGLHGNMLSKAALLLGVNNATERYGDKTVYFPAFEIMMDDLRDYRFYADDMKHPSATAIDYIYNLFAESFMDDSTRLLAMRCRELTRRLSHRILSPSPETKRKEMNQRTHLIDDFMNTYPSVKSALDTYIVTNKVLDQ